MRCIILGCLECTKVIGCPCYLVAPTKDPWSLSTGPSTGTLFDLRPLSFYSFFQLWNAIKHLNGVAVDLSKSGMLIYIQKLSTLKYFVDNSFTIRPVLNQGPSLTHGFLYLDEQLLNMTCLWWKFTMICFLCFFPMKIVKRHLWCTVSVVRNVFLRNYLQKQLILII